MTVWIFFIGLLILEAIADIYAKKFGINPIPLFFIISLALYAAANASWLMSMRAGMTLSKGVVLFAVIQSMLGIVIGTYMGEKLSPTQWVGVGLGITAILLIINE
jgi:drug/metabolite transporter (DMT)-like permease